MALGLYVEIVKPVVQIAIMGHKFTDVEIVSLSNIEPSNCEGLQYSLHAMNWWGMVNLTQQITVIHFSRDKKLKRDIVHLLRHQ